MRSKQAGQPRKNVPVLSSITNRKVALTTIAGVGIAALDEAEAVRFIGDLVGTRRSHTVVTCNVDHAVRLQQDPAFRAAYARAALITADGAPVVALGRLLGYERMQRVAGADLLPALSAEAVRRRWRIALVGGAPGVAEQAVQRLTERFPQLDAHAVTALSMGFSLDDREDRRAVAEIRALRPQLLFVCLGSPKQELWIEHHRNDLSTVMLGVGAAIDYVAGTLPRAPMLMRRLGLEWLFRLLSEPRRLWRRYLLRDSRFLVVAGRELLVQRVLRRRSPERELTLPVSDDVVVPRNSHVA